MLHTYFVVVYMHACMLLLPYYLVVWYFYTFGHKCKRHGRRNRYVPTRRPLTGYFTDTTSMSGAGSDVSANDASDEDSSEEGVCIGVAQACHTAMMWLHVCQFTNSL